MKKIKVIENTCTFLDEHINHVPLQDSLEEVELKQLKEYFLQEHPLNSTKEIDIIVEVLEWVSSQWEHDGFNEAINLTSLQILQNAKKGMQYRCVEYGKVVTDILISLGMISRTVSLKSIDVAYGGFGKGHVASEVWLNSLDKWIFIDPQVCTYPMYNGDYINFYEMYQLKIQGKFDDIQFMVPKSHLEKTQLQMEEYTHAYKQFIINYFGYLSIKYKSNNNLYSVVLYLNGKESFLTFEGLPDNNTLFTTDPKNFYYTLNHSIILFQYKNETDFNHYMLLMDQYKINTNDDYIKHMDKFVVEPNFILTFLHNMKWFHYFEVKIDSNSWKKIDSNQFEWNLNEGINSIQVRAVNQAGNKGVVSKMIIKYA